MATRQIRRPVLRRMCGTMECHHHLQGQDPDFRRRLIELEHDALNAWRRVSPYG